MRLAGPARPYTDPITLAPMLVRCKAGDQRSLFIENPAAIHDRAGKLWAQCLTIWQRLNQQHDIQMAYFCSERCDCKPIVRKGHRAKGHPPSPVGGNMPDLITVVLRVRLPDHNQ